MLDHEPERYFLAILRLIARRREPDFPDSNHSYAINQQTRG